MKLDYKINTCDHVRASGKLTTSDVGPVYSGHTDMDY
jgi:hypothetical protein